MRKAKMLEIVHDVRVYRDFNSRGQPRWYVDYNDDFGRKNTVELRAREREDAVFAVEQMLHKLATEITVE